MENYKNVKDFTSSINELFPKIAGIKNVKEKTSIKNEHTPPGE